MHVPLFKPSGPDRVAFVSAVPASDAAGALLVQVAKGPTRQKLREPKLFGPMTREIADQIFVRELDLLRAEGFVRGGLADLLTRIESKSRTKRALAARRLGWLRERAGVEPLLALAAKANEELPVVVDALGEIGDALAIPAARAAAERKLLSRRRSGVEALRKLGDKEGLAEARTRALARIPASVQAVLDSVVGGTAELEALTAALGAVPTKDRGLAIDSVYELGLEAAVVSARDALLASPLETPHLWRYTKSVLKRAMLRHDAATFGLLAHAIESKAGHSSGETATVKSGFDGQTKTLRIFGTKTQRYMQRLCWRYLRMVGRYRPHQYAIAAAEVLARYTDADATKATGLHGSYANCYLLGRILYGSSKRFVLDERSLRLRLKNASLRKSTPGEREESFPDLWDCSPLAYVRVLGSGLVILHAWALEALEKRHPRVVEEAPHAWILGMLDAPHPPTVELGLTELNRRFDPSSLDWGLLVAVLHDARENVRELGVAWIGRTVSLWALVPERVLRFFSGGDGAARAAVAAQVITALPRASAQERRALATAMFELLRAPEKNEGDHDGPASIARELAPELAAVVPVEELVAFLVSPSAGARSAAAAALAVHPEAERVLGSAELAVLAAHPQVSLRDAARALILRRLASLLLDPSPLFDLLGSEWLDMRTFAAGLLATDVDTSHLSLDALVGLADATHADVQDLAKQLIGRRIAELPVPELLSKLLEHPHRNMRRYVLDLVRSHLKEGFVALSTTEDFFRTVFLDVSPDRSIKRDAIAFLKRRGLADEHQAEIAMRLLIEVVRSKTIFDFELALEAIAQIKFASVTRRADDDDMLSIEDAP